MVNYAVAERSRHGRNFWLPIWILLAGVAFAAAFYLGAQDTKQQWSDEQNASLAVAAMRHPASALIDAESQLLADRIDFPLYRDLLRAALSREDAELLNTANQSIARVLASKRDPAKKLEKELESLPTQVFIVTSEGASPAARDIEQKLKRRETVVVFHETRAPRTKDISKTAVLYSDSAKQTAEYVTSLLQEDGFSIGEVKKSDGGATSFKKRVEIVLAEAKKKAPKAPIRRKRNRSTRPR
jgi:MFS superfamily sulfate permease-like transporter